MKLYWENIFTAIKIKYIYLLAIVKNKIDI